MSWLLDIDIPLWFPLLLALLAAICLYRLGAAEERRRQRNSLAERNRRHRARSLLMRI